MKNTAPRIAGVAIVVLAFALIAPSAFALPKTRHVGPSPTDCDYGQIQDAIDVASSGDTIIIDAGGTYASQHLNIVNKSIALGVGPCQLVIGGKPDGTQANTQATLSGDASATSAVITISGSGSVALNDLKISGNTHTNGAGGGIAFTGTGSLTLNNTTVSGNTSAAGGGGIEFNSTGTLTLNNVMVNGNSASSGGGVEVISGKLVLGNDTQIIGNTGSNGGGGILLLLGNLTAAGTGNLIANNHAPNGDGGALRLDGSTATITAAGIGTQPLFYLNSAKDGGAIALLAESAATASLNLGDVSGRPIVIDNNFASESGGGLYLQSDAGQSRSAAVSAFNVRLTNNSATDGAAIYSGCFSGFNCTPVNTISMESDGCQPGNCSAILENIATGSYGAIVTLATSTFDVSNTRISANVGVYLIGVASTSTVSASETLIADNAADRNLIAVTGSLKLSQCTFAQNEVGGTQMINVNGGLELVNSIIESAVSAVSQSNGSLVAHGVLGTNIAGLPTQNDILLSDPVFLDLMHADYRLRAVSDGKALSISPAIDFATASDTTQDLDGRPRPKDLATAGNQFGTYDVGAFEMQPITDRVFAGAFGDLYLIAQ